MPKVLVYAVYDSKVQTYAQPFQMRTRGEAIRGWEEVVNDSSTQISKWPEDYSLMELGEFDDSNGRYENLAAPLNLGLASQFKRIQKTTNLTEIGA